MNKKNAVYIIICLFLFAAPSSALAAPKTYFWGQQYGIEGLSFHRQSSNISEFHVTLPMYCTFVDGTTDTIEASVSGPDVPNLLVRRNSVNAEFSAYVEGLLGDGEVTVSARFRGNRAVFSVVVTSTFSDGECSGGIVYDSVRRGARVR